MKITKLIFAALLAFLFLNSCQKPFVNELATVTTTTAKYSLPKTYTENITTSTGHDSVTFNLSYDANGRLISMISASSPGDKFIYQYSGSTINFDLYNANVLDIHAIYFLNSSSYIDSSFQYNSTKDTSTEKYLYNVNKQLATLKEYDYSATRGATISNITNYTYDVAGNLIKDADRYQVNTYDYNTIINSFSIGFDFLPATKNLVKTTTNVNGGVTVKLNHTYTFDVNNRLTSEKIITSDGDIAIKSYTY